MAHNVKHAVSCQPSESEQKPQPSFLFLMASQQEGSREKKTSSAGELWGKLRRTIASVRVWPDRGTQEVRYGLQNQGSTCYLNSVLQVLYMTTEIHNRLDQEDTDKELRNIFERLKKETGTTEGLTQCLQIENINQQHDAAECLELILRRVSQQASEVFQGKLTYTTKCSRDHSINQETNPFWTLPLSLRDGTPEDDDTYSVETNFKRIFDKSHFGGDDLVFCQTCREKTEANSECQMEESPQILTLLLKRFDFDYRTMSHVKSQRCVGVPPVLHTEDKRYKLYGIVNHMGSLRGGHYTATVLSNEDKTWYELDDTRVRKVEEQPFEKSRIYNSSTAYLIMYRESVREKVTRRQDGGRGSMEDDRRSHRESNARGSEKRRNQESPVREVRNKGTLSRQDRRDEAEFKLETKVSGVETQKQHVISQHADNWTKAEKKRLRSKNEEDDNQPSKCSYDIKKHTIVIAGVVVGGIVIVIIIVILVASV